MKITKQVEIDVCEYADCKEENCYDHCFVCGATYCYEHRNITGRTLYHGVYCSGSDDIYICNKCESQIKTATPELQKLYNAYLRISALKQESKSTYDEFNKRVKEAEKTAKEEYEKNFPDRR